MPQAAGEPGRQPGDGPRRPACRELARAPAMPNEVKAVFEAQSRLRELLFQQGRAGANLEPLRRPRRFPRVRGPMATQGRTGRRRRRRVPPDRRGRGVHHAGGHLESPIGDDLADSPIRPAAAACSPRCTCGGDCWCSGRRSLANVKYLGTVPLHRSAGAHRPPRDGACWRHDRLACSAASQITGTCATRWSAPIGGVECRFMFDAKTGNLARAGNVPRPDDDPCELYFCRLRRDRRTRLPATDRGAATATRLRHGQADRRKARSKPETSNMRMTSRESKSRCDGRPSSPLAACGPVKAGS